MATNPLMELDVQIEHALKSGRIVYLPNGMHFKPTGKKDGSVVCDVRIDPGLYERINTGFRGKWINVANIGKSEAEIIELWNSSSGGSHRKRAEGRPANRNERYYHGQGQVASPG